MGSIIKPNYPNASFNDTITITFSSVTNNSARECTAISNTTNLDLDALVQVKVKTGASGTTTTGVVNIWCYGSADNGTTYPDNVTGSDAGITLVSPTNLVWLGFINCVANATTYKSNVFSIASALKLNFGLPPKYGIVLENKTGGTMDTTAGNFAYLLQRIQAQTV